MLLTPEPARSTAAIARSGTRTMLRDVPMPGGAACGRPHSVARNHGACASNEVAGWFASRRSSRAPSSAVSCCTLQVCSYVYRLTRLLLGWPEPKLARSRAHHPDRAACSRTILAPLLVDGDRARDLQPKSRLGSTIVATGRGCGCSVALCDFSELDCNSPVWFLHAAAPLTATVASVGP